MGVAPEAVSGGGWGTGRGDPRDLPSVSGILPSALTLLPFQISNSPIGPLLGEGSEAGTARERGCEIWEGDACWIELASAAASSLFCGRKPCGRGSPRCQHVSLGDLGETCCRGAQPRRKQFFSCAGTGNALGTEFPWVCAQSRTSAMEPSPSPGKSVDARRPRIAHPCPVLAHAHLPRSFILNPHPTPNSWGVETFA